MSDHVTARAIKGLTLAVWALAAALLASTLVPILWTHLVLSRNDRPERASVGNAGSGGTGAPDLTEDEYARFHAWPV